MVRTLRHSTFAFVIASLLSFSALANQGAFMIVKGNIEVIAKSGAKQKAKVGMKVSEGDTIVAGPDSRAKVVMVDKNVLQISPDSKVIIEKYKFDENKDEKSVSLNVLYGKMRSTVNQKYDGEKNQFNVKTPSAVAGVRGTDFMTGFSPVTKATKIVTFEGQVMAGSGLDAAGRIANAVPVNPGQFTVASAGAPPAAPVEVPKAELASMNNETKAETPAAPAGGGANGERAPSSDGGGEKSEGGNGGGANNGGPAPGPAAGPAPASMVDMADVGGGSTTNISAPNVGPVIPTINIPRPVDTSYLNKGPSRLTIQINK